MIERVSREEILRYLGYRDQTPDDAVRALIEDVLADIGKAAAPRRISRKVSCRIEGDSVSLDNLTVTSHSLAEHLSGCDEALLFAATLGIGIDRLLKRYARLQVSRAVVIQAAAAAVIEQYADDCMAELCPEGHYLRPRFSPGYGDLPLSFQQPLLDAVDAAGRLGIELNESMLMLPTKSITAIIGITTDRKSCTVHRCADCGKLDCPFRRSDRE